MAASTRIGGHYYDSTLAIRLFVTDCATCGVVFAVTENFEDRKRESGDTWYCPNGHSMVFRETEAMRLRKESERLAAQIERKDRALANAQEDARAAHASLVATKGHLTRVKKRADAGVCQHCNRSFANVTRHVAHMHPESVSA